MQQSPILILNTSEGSSSLGIEYINETAVNNEINGEAASHIFHVMMITEYLLRELSASGRRISEEDISAISIASALHDIGKKQIPKSIIDSPDVLSPLEYDIVKKHSALGEQTIREAELGEVDPKIAEYAAQIARSHHERIDGMGYPDGLRGDEIPLCAQVVSIADVYDALTSVRSYKQAFTQDVALQMIANGNCGAFDKELVACLGRVVKHRALVSFSETLKKRLSIVSDYEEIQLNRVLLVGNTAYLDKSFAERTFPQSKVMIRDSRADKTAKRPSGPPVEELLQVYEFDLIVFFAEGLSFHTKQKSDAAELRNLLKCASLMQKNAKFLYLSPLDAAFESSIDRAIPASANERLCEFYASKHGLNIKVIRIPYLYSGTCKNDFLYSLFEQLYESKTVTIPESSLSRMHFLSTSDLSELILRTVDGWRIGYGILAVGDEFRLTFADLAKKLTELDENAKVDFTDSDCSGILKFSNTDLRDLHGWFAKISLIDDLKDQYDAYLEIKEKKTVFTRIISSKDSFGRILNIAKTLNSVVPQHLYLKIVETFEEVLENKSIAVYLTKPGTPFGRLQVASRDTLDTAARSILLDDFAPVIDVIKNGGIWKNTELNVNYPAYAAGICRDGELILVIFLWHANSDQRSLYYVNLFKILCDLAQMSLLRAYDYSLAMYEKQYFPGTRIMNARYFEECIENYTALNAKKISSFVMLELEMGDYTLCALGNWRKGLRQRSLRVSAPP